MKFFLAIVFVILVFLSTTPAYAHTAITLVDITDDGFEPQEIEIDGNSTVRFFNKTRVDRWPASNPHPTHTIYSEFDPGKPIPAGSSWDFKPKKMGRWKYHDHLFPHQRGTLIVTGEANKGSGDGIKQEPAGEDVQQAEIDLFFSSVKRWIDSTVQNIFRSNTSGDAIPKEVQKITIDAFKQLGEQEQYQQLKAMSENQGLERTWVFVKTYPNEGHAHDLAHYTGSLIYEQRGIKGLPICDTTFAFGCFHGFTEAAFTNNLDQLNDVVNACESLGKKGSGPWASCIHGIGHGVATSVDVSDIDKALSICDALKSGQQYCWDGVFMEFTISAPRQFFEYGSLNRNIINPLTPCLALSKTYRNSCGRAIPKLLENRLQLRHADIAKICSSGSDKSLSDSCIDAIGLAIGQESTGRAGAVWQGCTGMPSRETYDHCMTAAAGELVFQNFPGWEVAAYHLCDSLDKPSSESCFRRVEQLATDYSR